MQDIILSCKCWRKLLSVIKHFLSKECIQEKACAALSNLACGDEHAKEAICRHGGVVLLVDVCRGKVGECPNAGQ